MNYAVSLFICILIVTLVFGFIVYLIVDNYKSTARAVKGYAERNNLLDRLIINNVSKGKEISKFALLVHNSDTFRYLDKLDKKQSMKLQINIWKEKYQVRIEKEISEQLLKRNKEIYINAYGLFNRTEIEKIYRKVKIKLIKKQLLKDSYIEEINYANNLLEKKFNLLNPLVLEYYVTEETDKNGNIIDGDVKLINSVEDIPSKKTRNNKLKEIRKLIRDEFRNGLTSETNLELDHILTKDEVIALIKLEKKKLKHQIKEDTSEYRKYVYSHRKTVRIISDIFFISILLVVLGFGINNKVNKNEIMFNHNTTLVIVQTGSMSRVHKNNTYIQENNLTNQIPTLSLISLQKVEDPSELKIFDVAAYKDKNNDLIIHRIIGQKYIDDVRHFIFRGDANENSDLFMVAESKVLYKYNNFKLPILGKFISFLISYYGLIVILYCYLSVEFLNLYDKRKDIYSLVCNVKIRDIEIAIKEDEELRKQKKKKKSNDSGGSPHET